MEKLNSNTYYADTGKNWEGAMTFVVQKDELFDLEAYIYLDLYHGKCRNAKFSFVESELPQTEYRYRRRRGTSSSAGAATSTRWPTGLSFLNRLKLTRTICL
jgi:hypothetical protein